MSRIRSLIIGGVVVLLLIGGIAYEIVRTQPVRGALRTCSELFTAANRPDLRPEERIETARACARGDISDAQAGRRAGRPGTRRHPRNLNKNFKAWREGANVWICPTNRFGPVYQFIFEDGTWRFDGLVGMLEPRGRVVPKEDLPEAE